MPKAQQPVLLMVSLTVLCVAHASQEQQSTRPAVPLSGVSVKHSVQKCACVVLVHCHANVLVSVHAGVCVRVVGAGSCGHAAHGLSDAPAPAGRGSPRGESQRARRQPRAATT